MCRKAKLVKRYSKTKSFRVSNTGNTYQLLNQGNEVVVDYREIPTSKERVKTDLRKLERELRRVENEKRLLLNDLDFIKCGGLE